MQDDTSNGSEERTAEQTDDLEWSQAIDNYSADKASKLGEPTFKKAEGEEQQTPEEKKAADEKAAAEKKVSDEQAAKIAADEAEAEKVKTETAEQTKARHDKEAADKKTAEAAAEAAKPSDPAIRTARQTQRQLAEAEQVMKEDIRKEMFSDVQTELLDADGDPIRTIEDVQKLMNPNTKKPFTEEEAASYLLQAQQHLNKTKQEAEAQIEKIAAVNLDLGDQADNVKAKFGAILETMPDIAKSIVTEYNKTLVTDPKTGTITGAPVNMESFFSIALAPYLKAAEGAGTTTTTTTAEDQAKKDAAEKKKLQTRQDRSDVYGGGKVETMDDDEKEWAEAAKVVYGNK